MRVAWSATSNDELAVSTLSGVLFIEISKAAAARQSLQLDLEDLPEGARLLQIGAAVTAVAFSPDRQWLAAGTEDGKVSSSVLAKEGDSLPACVRWVNASTC